MAYSESGIEQTQSGSRTFLGVIIHILSLIITPVGVLLIYIFSNIVPLSKFSRTNIKNCLNWQITLSAVLLPLIVYTHFFNNVSVYGIIRWTIAIVLALDICFVLYATYKAILGDAWEYPLTLNEVGRV